MTEGWTTPSGNLAMKRKHLGGAISHHGRLDRGSRGSEGLRQRQCFEQTTKEMEYLLYGAFSNGMREHAEITRSIGTRWGPPEGAGANSSGSRKREGLPLGDKHSHWVQSKGHVSSVPSGAVVVSAMQALMACLPCFILSPPTLLHVCNQHPAPRCHRVELVGNLVALKVHGVLVDFPIGLLARPYSIAIRVGRWSWKMVLEAAADDSRDVSGRMTERSDWDFRGWGLCSQKACHARTPILCSRFGGSI